PGLVVLAAVGELEVHVRHPSGEEFTGAPGRHFPPNWVDEARDAGLLLVLAGRAALDRTDVHRHRPPGRGRRSEQSVGDGPLLPDRRDRTAGPRDARGLYDPW